MINQKESLCCWPTLKSNYICHQNGYQQDTDIKKNDVDVIDVNSKMMAAAWFTQLLLGRNSCSLRKIYDGYNFNRPNCNLY